MKTRVRFHDHKPRELSLADTVIDGLSRANKAIPPKFLYDQRGSQLFDAICDQPEYYLPRAERGLLNRLSGEIGRLAGRQRTVFEPGAGSLSKIRLLLEPLLPCCYVPMDISADYLQDAAHNLSRDYPWLDVHATCVDFTHSIPLPEQLPDRHRLAFFPGSSLGNFEPTEAQQFLAMVQQRLGANGMLLIGVDTKKSARVLNAAYNDEAGVTAEFNLNLLKRLQRELSAVLEVDQFAHHAFYNEQQSRIEMHLVSRRAQTLCIGDHCFEFKAGESIHTENSYKYSPDEFLALARRAGFRPVDYWLAEQDSFALYLLEVSERTDWHWPSPSPEAQ
ncbi:L-histidine N(alpha)-methyltransferase [Marinobacterium arenosum]|uniref:L-histidine N(alpha)-methyltransferase n=1 Tax=Marinobacterium arenosum TaxID=2862496 RepID=UPI001C98502C|nr:L-histidine N(alpha)-methyltransferase [Marinobacterium arenosum]MBY4675118.1 L-histidine N(alpha)-methyltransferase [Marinobacterium arenosum]